MLQLFSHEKLLCSPAQRDLETVQQFPHSHFLKHMEINVWQMKISIVNRLKNESSVFFNHYYHHH